MSFPHTVQYVRVNHISFSRQNGETVSVHMPLVLYRLHLFFHKRYCLQHNTKQLFNVCLKLYHDARCIVKKIPEKFLTEVTFFVLKSFAFPFDGATAPRPRRQLASFSSRTHSHRRCSYRFKDTETAVPVI